VRTVRLLFQVSALWADLVILSHNWEVLPTAVLLHRLGILTRTAQMFLSILPMGGRIRVDKAPGDHAGLPLSHEQLFACLQE
jgi:hypothetical protein